ncbi:hypothetical protein LshimejAT787_0200610 [Lyophyllum shimeji]|uniref:Uncharacterized protein n=1 Tax=Lyophyllum shimeji TaxID=47721 RepID=A0A9P3UKL6_LYOSH|nr:hypothetical protein LshimejAT787_0200610 [Lyophyllum shimeji]
MARLPFSLFTLSERVESVLGAIQTSLAMAPDRSVGDRAQRAHTAAELAAWRRHQPYLQHLASCSRYGPPMITDRDGESSMEGTDGSETLVSEDETPHTFYALPTAKEDRLAYVLGGKIIPNIANFDFDRDSDDGQAQPDPADSASDTDSFYSYDDVQPASPAKVEANPAGIDPPIAGPANRIHDLTEGVTALSPPPLRHSGRTRSKVVFVPRDTPGTCPIHGCADCGLCDSNKPLLFTI